MTGPDDKPDALPPSGEDKALHIAAMQEDPKSQSPEDDFNAPPSDADDMPLDKKLSRQINGPGRKISALVKNPKYVKIGFGGMAILLIVLMIYACQPQKGPMAFGICSAFLELNTPYPHTLRLTDYEGSQTAIRIYFTNVDPFGEFRQEMIECTFGSDEQSGIRLAQVMRNRRPVDRKLIEDFNLTIPAVIASDPYRVLPPNWKNPLVKEYYQQLPE